MSGTPRRCLGRSFSLDGSGVGAPFDRPAHHLVTHGAIVGTTGSAKTGLVTVLVEEALRARVPVLMIDVKGDLPGKHAPPLEPGSLRPGRGLCCEAWT